MFKKTINFPTDKFLFYEKSDTFTKKAAENNFPEILLNAAEKAYKLKTNDKDVVIIASVVFPYEIYQENNNGDIFLKEYYEGINLNEDDILPKYVKTMEDKQMSLYHDLNKPIGKIYFAHYNEDQDRVEIVSIIYWDKAPNVINKLKAGFSLNVSMQCAIKYDICTVCGNIAHKPEEHCTHVEGKNVTKIFDGIPAGMINVGVNFIEVSVVIVPGESNARIEYVKK